MTAGKKKIREIAKACRDQKLCFNCVEMLGGDFPSAHLLDFIKAPCYLCKRNKPLADFMLWDWDEATFDADNLDEED